MKLKMSWTNANEVNRRKRLRIYYDLIEYRYNSISLKIIALHDHKGDLTVTLKKAAGFVHGINATAIEEDILRSVWQDAFGEMNCKIIYDEGADN